MVLNYERGKHTLHRNVVCNKIQALFNGKGSNEIWQVARNYGKWQQDMKRNMKSKIVNKNYQWYEYMESGKHEQQGTVVSNKMQ